MNAQLAQEAVAMEHGTWHPVFKVSPATLIGDWSEWLGSKGLCLQFSDTQAGSIPVHSGYADMATQGAAAVSALCGCQMIDQ